MKEMMLCSCSVSERSCRAHSQDVGLRMRRGLACETGGFIGEKCHRRRSKGFRQAIGFSIQGCRHSSFHFKPAKQPPTYVAGQEPQRWRLKESMSFSQPFLVCLSHRLCQFQSMPTNQSQHSQAYYPLDSHPQRSPQD